VMLLVIIYINSDVFSDVLRGCINSDVFSECVPRCTSDIFSGYALRYFGSHDDMMT